MLRHGNDLRLFFVPDRPNERHIRKSSAASDTHALYVRPSGAPIHTEVL